MNEFRQKLLRRTETIPDREKRRLSGGSVLLLLFAALALAVLLSFGLGRYPVGMKELLGILAHRLGVYRGAPFWSETQAVAVWNVRMPRVLLSVLVGASLASAGAAFQGAFQNPMASPDILSASAGAGACHRRARPHVPCGHAHLCLRSVRRPRPHRRSL